MASSDPAVRYRTLAAVLVVVVVTTAVAAVTPLPPLVGLAVSLPVAVVVALLSAGPALRRWSHRTGTGPLAWTGALALALAGVAVAHAVGDPRPFCEEVTHRGCLTGYGLGAVAFFGGAFALAVAAGNLGPYRRVRGRPVTGAGDVEPGPVALAGTVETAGDAVRAPVTGHEAVGYRAAVAERGGEFENGRWHTVATAEAAVPFYVSDATGRVLVDPGTLRLSVTRSAVSTYPVDDATVVEAGESLPASLRAFEADRRPDGPRDPPGTDRKYQETRLEPHDPVFVVGKAVRVPRIEYPERVVVAGVDGARAPDVYAGSPADVRRTLRWRVAVAGAFGLLFAAAGFAAMVLAAAG